MSLSMALNVANSSLQTSGVQTATTSRNIAGVINKQGNVLGIMPHPDRAFEAELGSADGALLFQSVLASA